MLTTQTVDSRTKKLFLDSELVGYITRDFLKLPNVELSIDDLEEIVEMINTFDD